MGKSANLVSIPHKIEIGTSKKIFYGTLTITLKVIYYNMESLAKLKKNPKKVHAIELLVLHPEMTYKDVAAKLDINKKTLEAWKSDPNFVEAYYDRYMVEFGMNIPDVLSAMIREAKEGNVQAGRLVLEHSGKLVKNINVTVDSPFEKFLKEIEPAEIVEDADIVEVAGSIAVDESLPPRNEEDQGKRMHREKIRNAKVIKDVEKKAAYNEKQKEWYKWRKRAEKVGVAPLKGRRPTPAQRKTWERAIIKAEGELDGRENG